MPGLRSLARAHTAYLNLTFAPHELQPVARGAAAASAGQPERGALVASPRRVGGKARCSPRKPRLASLLPGSGEHRAPSRLQVHTLYTYVHALLKCEQRLFTPPAVNRCTPSTPTCTPAAARTTARGRRSARSASGSCGARASGVRGEMVRCAASQPTRRLAVQVRHRQAGGAGGVVRRPLRECERPAAALCDGGE